MATVTFFSLIFTQSVICFAAELTEFDWLDKGSLAASKSDYITALTNYNSAINSNPDFALAYYYRGLIYSNTGDYNHAIEDFTKALTYQPVIVKKCVELLEKAREEDDGDYTSICSRARGDYNQIDKDIKEVTTRLDTLSNRPYFITKQNAIRSGRNFLKKLESDFTTLLKAPDLASVYFQRGLAYGHFNHKQAVFADFEKAEELGFDFEEIKSGKSGEKPKPKPVHRGNKITKEDIEFINSLNPLQRMVFGKGLTLHRLNYYLKIVERNSKSSVFLNGWINRAASVGYGH
ncbi:MAG: tetratricopeptide repeat protein [Desulfuromonadales bacterium]|nr:tetratricopeptide repeat protein [Desulfuromonadales bacterium]